MQFQTYEHLIVFPNPQPLVTRQLARVLLFRIHVHLAKYVVLKTMTDALFPQTTAAAINNPRLKVRSLHNN